MLYHNARLYDEWEGEDYEGSSCRGALKGWHRHGVCDAKLWPYRDNKGNVKFIEPSPGWSKNAIETPLGSYYRINIDSVVDMQSAIFEVGAIYCSAGVHDGWNEPQASATKDRTDPFNYLPSVSDVVQEENGGHAFAIVGYTRDGFIVQNSWNTSWGFCVASVGIGHEPDANLRQYRLKHCSVKQPLFLPAVDGFFVAP